MISLDTTFATQMQQENQKLKQVNTNHLEDEALRKVCNDFESFFTQQFLDVSLKETNIAGEGTGSDIIKGMYTQALSQSTNGTFGISDMLYKFLSENNK